MPVLGKVGLVNKGNYSSSTTYNVLDFVYYDGSTYICLKNGVKNVTPSADGTNWQYLAKGFIADTSVFIKKSDMRDAFNVTSAGTYVADAHALKTLKDTADGYGTRITALESKNYTGTSPIVVNSNRAISLATSGVTAKAYGDTAAKAPGFGGSFSVPGFTVDSYGRLTAANAHNVTLPTITSIDGVGVQTGTITWITSFTHTDEGTWIKKFGKIVILHVNFTSNTDLGTGQEQIATVPSGYAPFDNGNKVPASINVYGNNGGVVNLAVFHDRAIKVMGYRGSTTGGLRALVVYTTE